MKRLDLKTIYQKKKTSHSNSWNPINPNTLRNVIITTPVTSLWLTFGFFSWPKDSFIWWQLWIGPVGVGCPGAPQTRWTVNPTLPNLGKRVASLYLTTHIQYRWRSKASIQCFYERHERSDVPLSMDAHGWWIKSLRNSTKAQGRIWRDISWHARLSAENFFQLTILPIFSSQHRHPALDSQFPKPACFGVACPLGTANVQWIFHLSRLSKIWERSSYPFIKPAQDIPQLAGRSFTLAEHG